MHPARGNCTSLLSANTFALAVYVATNDAIPQPDTHLAEGIRTGVRASGIGEVPYLDPASTGRREALGLQRF